VSAAAGIVTPIIEPVEHVLANETNWQQMPHR